MLRTKNQPTMVTVKSRLAQLLATENIRVQHLPTKTAYFDMQNRVLTCPIWKDMDGDLYDLCMGHEVGHALNTPAEGWHGALVQMGKGYQTYMNVVEDARIERKIKTKFPGLKAPFARAYAKLDERDMFGLRRKNLKINKLGLIDRLNIHFKLGHIHAVSFTDEERVYIARIERAETWEDVRTIADELYARAKKHKDKLPEMEQSGMPQEQDSDDQSDGGDQQEQDSKSEPKKSDKKNDKKEDKKSKDKKDDKDGDTDTGEEDSKKSKSKDGDSKDESEMTDEELAEAMDNAQDGSRPEDDENEYDEDDQEGSGSGDSDEDSDEEGDESSEGGGDEADDSEGDDGEGSADESDDGDDEEVTGEDSGLDNDADGASSNKGDADEGTEDEDDDSDNEVEGSHEKHDADDEDSAGDNVADRIHDGNDLPDDPDPTSLTDEAFRSAEENLVDQSATAIRTLYLPDTKNVDEMITPIDLTYTSIEDGITRAFKEYQTSFGGPTGYGASKEPFHSLETFSKMSVEEIIKNNKKYVDLLVKEFELRKNASEYRRQLVAKTGELDVNRLHQYKFTNDLFRKVTTVQKGKSHGMVFFLDMSSSMEEIMGHTVRQLLVLVMFCKKVGVPFDVYGFSDGGVTGFRPAAFRWQQDTIQCRDRQFTLRHLLSSSLGGNEFRRAFAALAMYSNIFYGQHSKEIAAYLRQNRYNVAFSENQLNMVLNGTPFNKMLLASREIIEKFRARHMVDIVNVIHLTDGEGTDPMRAPDPNVGWSDPNYQSLVNARINYTDRKTQISHIADKYEKSQQVLTEMVKKITGCRHIAFYVADQSTIGGYIHNADTEEQPAATQSLKEFGFFKIKHLGYDSYYYMGIGNIKGTEISDDESIPLEERFINAQKAKAKQRAMAKQFATELAEQVTHNN